jgi:hypothetical protein
MIGCDVYDLGKAPMCGVIKLPFPANGLGEYYIIANLGDASIQLTTPEITDDNAYFYINASKLPIRRDLILSIYSRLDNDIETFNLTRNIGSDCYVENQTKCFSKFRIYLEQRLGIEEYTIEFPVNGGSAGTLLYYDIRFVNANTFVSTYNLPDFSLYTTVSVNASLKVWVDGIKYYYNDNIQDFSDQIIVNGNTITFLESVNGGRVEVELYDNLVLR